MPNFLVALIIAYLMGSFPTGYLLGRWLKGIDLREVGSGNPGATNVARVIGKGYGLLVLIIDALKGYIPARYFISLFNLNVPAGLHIFDLQMLIGLAAIVGHIRSIFLKFRGGKGVATSSGVFLAVAPVPFLITASISLSIIALTGYVSLGSISGAIILPMMIFLLLPEAKIVFYISVCLALLVIFLHSANIKRLLSGKESRIK
ncbi:MAG: glycerol-3-phosphate 1-O-acyltransferase PlsY [Candidatus Sumerlaeia bacterium]|nr:glycerol-3-phosphate 1-O-acyltransferase PlsY [Candidatus Sumerlaeia bacterium]